MFRLLTASYNYSESNVFGMHNNLLKTVLKRTLIVVKGLIYMFLNERSEGRKKEASKVKQTNMYVDCSNPRHSYVRFPEVITVLNQVYKAKKNCLIYSYNNDQGSTNSVCQFSFIPFTWESMLMLLITTTYKCVASAQPLQHKSPCWHWYLLFSLFHAVYAVVCSTKVFLHF